MPRSQCASRQPRAGGRSSVTVGPPIVMVFRDLGVGQQIGFAQHGALGAPRPSGCRTALGALRTSSLPWWWKAYFMAASGIPAALCGAGQARPATVALRRLRRCRMLVIGVRPAPGGSPEAVSHASSGSRGGVTPRSASFPTGMACFAGPIAAAHAALSDGVDRLPCGDWAAPGMPALRAALSPRCRGDVLAALRLACGRGA